MNLGKIAISMKQAGFELGDIFSIIFLTVILSIIWYILKNNTNAMREIAEGIKILTYQSRNKYLDEDETEKYVDRVFKEHINKKWILLCDLMDENGFNSELRREQVKEQVASGFDTYTEQEKEELNEYLTTWGSHRGTKFFNMYLEIRSLFFGKVYTIIFSDSKRSVKKREFYSLCNSELVKIKSKLKN